MAVGLVFGLAYFWRFSAALPNVDDLMAAANNTPATTIVSQDGVVLARLDTINRQPVDLDAMAKNLVNATVAVEDHRFFEHKGVDLWGVARAAWADLRRKNATSQGASTLTQQLVRTLPQFGLSRQKRYSRKIQEALTAMRVEQMYTKQDILKLYLNTVYYGGGAFGVQAASELFFGKSASKLTLSEAALIAGLPQRPTAYSPFDHLDAATRRRDEVLDAMQTYGYISADQNQAARNQRLRLMPRPQHREFDFKAPYFTTYVLGLLRRHYGADLVYSGLRVETTLNYEMQRTAEDTVENGLENASGYGANQGALVSLDPNTGYIRAMVGGRSFHTDQFNIVTQGRRQPGSTFKLFDYTAAFDTGTADLDKTYEDKPVPYPGDPKHRVVHNYSGRYSYGRLRCLDAIRWSVNTVAVQVARDVGITTVIDYAHRLGITTKLQPYLPTALGASEVRPLDLCSAFSTFANHGNRYKPMAIVRVVDAEGNVLEDNSPDEDTDIIKPDTVDAMNTALAAVVTSGTGTRARSGRDGVIDDAHGKTGTTSDFRDAWFAGYTGDLCTVIWVGSVHKGRNGRKVYAEMPGAAGGALCAPMWYAFMSQAIPVQKRFRLGSGPADENPPDDTQPRRRKHSDDTANAVKKPGSPAGAAQGVPAEALPGSPSTPPNAQVPAPGGGQGPAPTGASGQAPPAGAEPSPAPLTPAPRAQTPSAVPQPAARAAAPPQPRRRSAPAAPDRLVSVRICVDSGELATEWCDATKMVRLPESRVRRMHRCTLHHAPPGENP